MPRSSRVDSYVQTVKSQGIFGECMDMILAIQDEGNTYLLQDVLPQFYDDNEAAIARLKDLLIQPAVEFSNLNVDVHLIAGSTSSFGGTRMSNACCELREAVHQQNRERSLAALEAVRCEFGVLRCNLDILVQMQRDAMEAQAPPTPNPPPPPPARGPAGP